MFLLRLFGKNWRFTLWLQVPFAKHTPITLCVHFWRQFITTSRFIWSNVFSHHSHYSRYFDQWWTCGLKVHRSGWPSCRLFNPDFDHWKGGNGSYVGPQTDRNSRFLKRLIFVTLASVPPWERCARAINGYVPFGRLRSLRAEIAFSAEYGGLQLHLENSSW